MRKINRTAVLQVKLLTLVLTLILPLMCQYLCIGDPKYLLLKKKKKKNLYSLSNLASPLISNQYLHVLMTWHKMTLYPILLLVTQTKDHRNYLSQKETTIFNAVLHLVAKIKQENRRNSHTNSTDPPFSFYTSQNNTKHKTQTTMPFIVPPFSQKPNATREI